MSKSEKKCDAESRKLVVTAMHRPLPNSNTTDYTLVARGTAEARADDRSEGLETIKRLTNKVSRAASAVQAI